MDQIKKALRSLDARQRKIILDLLLRIPVLDLEGLDVKKLKGHEDLFRVKKGKLRIVFRKVDGRGIPIQLRYRDKAYKKLK